MNGGFAEYVAFGASKVFPIHNLSDEEATLVEPCACAIHGLDKLSPPVGVEGWSRLVIAIQPTAIFNIL
jgi:D-arabinitol dehydrogenase (NADP+)